MSDAGSTITDITSAYKDKLNTVAPRAVWIQLGLMAILGLGGLIGFSLLRPTNSVIYQPKVKYSEDGKRPPKIDKGFFSWVKPLMNTKEDQLMKTIGLDAVCYLRFLRMCRNMFLAIAVLTVAVLLPIDVAYNVKNVTSSDKNYLSMLTIQNVQGAWLWVHVAFTYLITLVVFYFVWTNYASMVRLKWVWFRSDEYQNSLHARSLLITQVAKATKSDAGIASLLNSLQIPYPTTAVHIGRKVGQLPDLIKAHNDAVRDLEGVLTRYFKDPNRLPSRRPRMRVGGGWGMGGEKVDAIDYLTGKIRRFDERIEAARQQIQDKQPENYGFASFESVPYAHIVAKRLAGKRKNGAHFNLAPQPTDIIWANITKLDAARSTSKFFGGVILVAFFIFYLVPLLVVSLLANITALSSNVAFINDWANNYPTLMSAFVGIVPPLLSVILQLLLPMVIRGIASYQGATTHSQSDRTVTARYSAFLIFSQFFVFSLLGVFVQVISNLVADIQGHKSASTILDHLSNLPGQLQYTWVIQSTYWLTVFPLRGASAIFDLAQLVSLLIVWGRARLFGRTPRDIREWTKPPEFDYAVYFSNHLLMVAVGFVYAPLAPMVALFAAVAFAISSYVYKYQLMYVFVSRVETGGRLWRVVINRVLFSLLMMHSLMLLTIGLQFGWIKCVTCAPPMLGVIIFKFFLARQFDDRFTWFIPSEAEINEAYLHHADARKHRLQKRFGHPSLHEPLFTPMLHKNVQHLLPTIYNGRIGMSQGMVDGKRVDQNLAGGLTFNMLEAHDLTYDRNEYLRQRDEDAQTVTTATPYLGGKEGGGDDYFNARRAEYLQAGGRTGTPGPGTPDDLPYELQRMPTTNSMGSTDNLIPSYPPRYAPQRGQGQGHYPNLSQQSFDPNEMLQTYPQHQQQQYPPQQYAQQPQYPPSPPTDYQPHHRSNLSQQSFTAPGGVGGGDPFGGSYPRASTPEQSGGGRPTYGRVRTASDGL